MQNIKAILLLTSLLILAPACKKKETGGYKYHIPEATDDGWLTGSCDEAGLSSATLSGMMDLINETPGHNIHSILIFKNGKLVFEQYFEGYLYSNNPPGSNGNFIQYDKLTDHYLASISKTITSVVFGIAMKQGYIDNVDRKVIDIFPEYRDILTGQKADITLKHLLTMSSGLAWDESSAQYGSSANDLTAQINSADPLAFVLSRPLVTSPGTQSFITAAGQTCLGQ